MFKVLQYIFYPPRFIADMRAFRVAEHSVFLLFFIGLLLGYYWNGGAAMSGREILFTVLFCLFSYGQYVYYKVHWMPYLTLYFSIATIALVWSYIAESLLYALSIYFGWSMEVAGPLAGYMVWVLVYIIVFHAICRDMEGRQNEGQVVVRRS